MATPDELIESVNEFHALTTQAKRWIGGSPIAEMLLLEFLIAKYPEQARHKLADHDAQYDPRPSPAGER